MEGHIHVFAIEISLVAMPGPQFHATHSKFKIELLWVASWYISIDISNAQWWQVQGVDRIFHRITKYLFIYKVDKSIFSQDEGTFFWSRALEWLQTSKSGVQDSQWSLTSSQHIPVVRWKFATIDSTFLCQMIFLLLFFVLLCFLLCSFISSIASICCCTTTVLWKN